jgi:hypothetical protein
LIDSVHHLYRFVEIALYYHARCVEKNEPVD